MAGIVASGRGPGADRTPPHLTRNKGVRIGLIGAGNHGTHIGNALMEMGYDLVAVCDLAAERMRGFVERKPDILATSSISELTKSDPEVVIVATLAESHLPSIRKLCDLGVRRVLCEKPVVANLSDLEELRGLVESDSIDVRVNHCNLWSPDYQRIRERIRCGDLGKLRGGSFHFKPAGFANMGCHYLAHVLSLLETPLHSVESASFGEDGLLRRADGHEDRNGLVVFGLPDGVRLTFVNLPTSPERAWRLGFEFEHGRIDIFEGGTTTTWTEWNARARSLCERSFELPGLGLIKNPSTGYALLDLALSRLLDGEPDRSFEYGCEAVEAIIGAHQCFVSGAPIALPPSPSDTAPFRFS